MKNENEKLVLHDSYYNTPCKILINSSSYVSQEEVCELEKKFTNYEIKEIGYQSPVGYRYIFAAFDKK